MPNQPQFTPAPWEAFDLGDPNYFPSVYIGPELEYDGGSGKYRDRIVVNVGPTPDEVRSGKGSGGTTDETANANARLIAASPDLYKALKPFAQAADAFDQFGDDGLWARNVTIGELRRARAAIAQVESMEVKS